MNLRKAPFALDEYGLLWVEKTLKEMTLEEKVGQLFCPIGYSTHPDELNRLLRFKIGALFFREGPGEEMRRTFAYAQQRSRIPLLIPSNLEGGGDGAALDGTAYGKPLACAATQDKETAYRLGKIAGAEGAALGINWAFAPVVDIDYNVRNPITNIRTFGDDPDRVLTFGREYIRGLRESGIAAALKHFPGDGIDERDQHLLTSVNSLSREAWDKTYGKIYQQLIDEGVRTIMAGHIALPAYQEYYEPDSWESVVPASLSAALLQQLLRKKMGFNGLIITDATPMVGFTAAMKRAEALPAAIENGCDMILFNKDLAEDYQFMLDACQNGRLSRARLEAANRRILALKASLNLHKKQQEDTLVPKKSALQILQCERHVRWAKELAEQSITLVKDTQKLLPLSNRCHHRVLLEILGDFPSNERVMQRVSRELADKGFAVTRYEQEDFAKGVDNVTSFRDKYDLVIYLGNVENASNKTTNRLNWYTFWGQGNNVPWFVCEVPTMFISLGNPYHLLDVPMIKTYLNCYANHDRVLTAVVDKITGHGTFTGENPIDPFCGRSELAY